MSPESSDHPFDKLAEHEILALTIYGEARGESIEGKIAVGNVIRNRVIKRNQTYSVVCLYPYQFSCWNENDPNRAVLLIKAEGIIAGKVQDLILVECLFIAQGIVDSKIRDNIKGFDHYMTTTLFNSEKRPSWARNPKKDPISLGKHTFLLV